MSTMIFYPCGSCGIAEGLNCMHILDEDITDRIERSALPGSYYKLTTISLLQSHYDCQFSQQVQQVFEPLGVLKGSKYVCKSCVSQLPSQGDQFNKRKRQQQLNPNSRHINISNLFDNDTRTSADRATTSNSKKTNDSKPGRYVNNALLPYYLIHRSTTMLLFSK